MNEKLIGKIENALGRNILADEMTKLKAICESMSIGVGGESAIECYLTMVALTESYDLHEKVMVAVGYNQSQVDVKKQAGVLLNLGTNLAKKTIAENLPKFQAMLKRPTVEEAKVKKAKTESDEAAKVHEVSGADTPVTPSTETTSGKDISDSSTVEDQETKQKEAV